MKYTFEEDKKAFRCIWGRKAAHSDAFIQQLFENYYTPYYGAKNEDDLIAIFGDYVVWKPDYNIESDLE